MNEFVDRVARTIFEKQEERARARHLTKIVRRWEDRAEFHDDFREIARAVITAMSELTEALAFYAEPQNWRSPSSGFVLQYDPVPSPIEQDQGARAREALK